MSPAIPETLAELKVPIGDLEHYPGNPRRGDVAALKASLERNGQYRPIVVNRRNQEVLAGNHTLRAARELGWHEIAVTYVDADDDQAARIALVDNRANDVAGYDAQALADLLRSLPDLAGTGYDADALEAVLADLDDQARAGQTDPEDIPEPPAETATEPGTVWQLDGHRLICGDATDPATLKRLMDGETADLVVTDPPYNVAYTGKTEDALTIQNDEMSAGAFADFLRAAFAAAAAVTRPGGPIYVWHADTETLAFRTALAETGWLHKQTLIWVKQTFVLGRQDYQWQHEPCLYGWRDGAAHRWFGGFDKTTIALDDADRPDYKALTKPELLEAIADLERQAASTVLREDKPSASEDHPTMKPVRLLVPLVRNSSVQGNRVLDPFAGAGSTLIACEQLDRHARLAEIDPVYCDVIVRRWEEFTGRSATRDG